MAKPPTANGAAKDLPEGWESWPGVNEATRQLGTNYKVLSRLVAEGAIQRIDGAPDGRPRLNPEDVKALMGSELLSTIDARPGLTPEDFKAGNELVKLVHTHHAQMVPLLVDGYKAMLSTAQEQLEAARAELSKKDQRIKELEVMRDQTALEREKMLTQEHERMLMVRTVDAQERRKDRALSAVTDKFAPLVLQKLGVGDPKMQLGMKFLSTVKRDQLLGLLAVKMLEPEQEKIVRQLLEPLTPEEKQALGETDTVSAPKAETKPPA